MLRLHYGSSDGVCGPSGGICLHISRHGGYFAEFAFTSLAFAQVLFLGLNPQHSEPRRLHWRSFSLQQTVESIFFFFMNGKLAIDRERALHEHGVTRY